MPPLGHFSLIRFTKTSEAGRQRDGATGDAGGGLSAIAS
jgi:hypothetical protein